MPSTARAFAPSAEPAWPEDAGAAPAEIEALQLAGMALTVIGVALASRAA